MSEEEIIEAKSLTEEISEFNRNIEIAIGQLTQWKSNLLNIQDEFVEKLKQKTLGMKIQ